MFPAWMWASFAGSKLVPPSDEAQLGRARRLAVERILGWFPAEQ
jgi:hypothetical protein